MVKIFDNNQMDSLKEICAKYIRKNFPRQDYNIPQDLKEYLWSCDLCHNFIKHPSNERKLFFPSKQLCEKCDLTIFKLINIK